MHETLGKYRPYLLLILLTTCSFLLITFQIRVLDNLILICFTPIQNIIIKGSQKISDSFLSFSTLLAMEKEYKRMRSENFALRRKLLQFDEMEAEISRLHAMLKFTPRVPIVTLPARVIGQSTSSWGRALLLDRGKADGVSPYQGVITLEGVVGRILSSTRQAAKMQLILNKNCSVAAMDEKTRAQGIIRGLGISRGMLEMTYVYYRSPLSVGDRIVTSGLDGVFPKGLLIGTVKELKHLQNDMFYSTVTVEPAALFSTLEYVLIVLNTRQPEGETEDE